MNHFASTQVDGEHEAFCWRLCLRPYASNRADFPSGFNSVTGRRIVVLEDITEHFRCFRKYFLCALTCNRAVADSPFALAFDSFNEHFVATEPFPIAFGKPVFFPYVPFRYDALAKSCEVLD